MKKLFIPILILALILNPFPISAQTLHEYEIKAAFLYQFTKFIEWPKEKVAEGVRVCIYGRDPFGEVIDQLETEMVHGSEVEVERVRSLNSIDSCSLLFVSASEKDRVSAVLSAANGKPLVTVGEIDGFIEKGGMIGFVHREKRIQFEINQKKAQQEGITISSKLLSLASQVIKP